MRVVKFLLSGERCGYACLFMCVRETEKLLKCVLSSSETNASLFWYQVFVIYSFFVDNNQFSCLFIFLVIGTFAKTINKRSLRNADSFSHGNSVWIYCLQLYVSILRLSSFDVILSLFATKGSSRGVD